MSELALIGRQDIDTMSLGQILYESGYFSDTKSAAQAVVKVLAGRELGFGPIASMSGIYIIGGKPSVSAMLMGAAVKRSGHYNYRVQEHTADTCRIEFYQNGESIGTSEFTSADAKMAGTKNMNKFPRNMLFARAMSNGAKWFCPDILGGPVYTPEEMGADVDEDGGVIEISLGGTVTKKPDLDVVPEDEHQGPEPFPSAEAAIAWGYDQGAFKAKRHARNAYEKCKKENEPKNAREMTALWRADVFARLEGSGPENDDSPDNGESLDVEDDESAEIEFGHPTQSSLAQFDEMTGKKAAEDE